MINPITIVILQPFVSRLLGRFSPYSALYFGCAVLILSNIVFLLAPDPRWLAVGMFIFTIGEMAITPAEYDLVNRFATPAYRGTYFGAHSLGEIGNFLGPWSGGLILASFGGGPMFVYFAAITLLAMPAYARTRFTEACRSVSDGAARPGG